MTARHRIPPPSLFFLVLSCTLSLGSGGCSKRACFEWTKAEGPCPSQAEALEFFGESACGSPIESVDSEPEFDGELCCYDVTERPGNDVPCPPSARDSKPPGSGAGGIPMCLTCSMSMNNKFMGLPTDPSCPDSVAIFAALLSCLCQGACQTFCGDNICLNASAGTACFDCATDSATGCGNEISACMSGP